MAKVLVIEDDETRVCETIRRSLPRDGFLVDGISWKSLAMESVRERRVDLIVIVAGADATRLVEFFEWERQHRDGAPTIAVLQDETDANVLHACCEATDDFVLGPLRPAELSQRIVRVIGNDARRERRGARARLDDALRPRQLVGNDPSFVEEIEKIPRAARTDSEVLITGETGTGKELCARAIHNLSARRDFPLICVDCGTLPDQLFENEMFGHERGAFTDAHRAQKGLVAAADRGTLFLDEIDSLTLSAQAKLLRFLQDRTHKPLGGEAYCHADARIVVATNCDLERAVADGRFRRDLFFRINVLRLHMIPLRERRGDVDLLAGHFLALCCAEQRCDGKVLASSSLRLLRSLEWPGNARELYNVIRRAVVFAEGRTILPSDILTSRSPARVGGDRLSFREARGNAMTAFEQTYVKELLRRHAGNITRAASAAGKDRREFGRLVKRHRIDPLALR
jgi:DNA-binding NtrC family response regulator